MPPSAKKHKVDNDHLIEDKGEEASNVLSAGSGDDVSSLGSGEDMTSSDDTETEIALAQQPTKSKKTAKRKRRAVSPTPFARALNTLLDTEAPNAQPLSLRPAVSRQKNEEKLEQRAKKLLIGEKRENEEKGRVRDVIGGWGGESERALRKVAQRGVVKLFNVIQLAQNTAERAETEAQNDRGTGKPSLPAPSADGFGAKGKSKKKGAKNKDNIVGRAKEVSLGQDAFLDIIRSGGIVAKK